MRGAPRVSKKPGVLSAGRWPNHRWPAAAAAVARRGCPGIPSGLRVSFGELRKPRTGNRLLNLVRKSRIIRCVGFCHLSKGRSHRLPLVLVRRLRKSDDGRKSSLVACEQTDDLLRHLRTTVWKLVQHLARVGLESGHLGGCQCATLLCMRHMCRQNESSANKATNERLRLHSQSPSTQRSSKNIFTSPPVSSSSV